MWNGEDRRESKDHDLLTRIDANLTNFMSEFKDHTAEDKKSFEEIRKEQDVIKKYLYLFLGGLIVFEFVLKMAFK